jgi:hypothetical protein
LTRVDPFFLFQLQALAGEIAAAEVDDVPAEGVQGAELAAAGLIGGAVPLEEGGGVAGGEDAEEPAGPIGVGEVAVAGGGELAGLVAEFALGLPAGEAVGAPFGEVLLGDGAAVKFAGEKGPDGRERIEPGEEGGAGFGVGEAAVEFVAQGLGEPGDFRGLTHRWLKEVKFFFDFGHGFRGDAPLGFGEEFFLDVGALEPLAEFLFIAGLGFVAVDGELGAGDFDGVGGAVAAAKAYPIADAGAEEFPAARGGRGGELGMGGGEVFGGEPAGDGVGDGTAGGFLVFLVLGGDLAEELVPVGIGGERFGIHGFLILG